MTVEDPPLRETARGRGKGWLACLALSVLFFAGVSSFVDPDVFHALTLIREAARTGSLPLDDVFAYTPTVRPVVHHEWAHAAILYSIISHSGSPGFLAYKHLLTAIVALGTFAFSRWRGASLGVLCPLAPIAIFMGWMGTTTIRAQLYTLIFTLCLLCFLELDRRGKKTWILPFLGIHVLWLNLHAGFVVGVALLLLHTVEQLLRRQQVAHLIATLLALTALISLNPFGLAYYPYLIKALLLDRALVPEWAPVWHAFPPLLFMYVLSLIVGGYAIGRLGLSRAAGALVLGGAALAALKSQRHLSIYAIVWFFHVPSMIEMTPLGEILRRFGSRRRAPALLWGTLLVLGAVGMAVSRPWQLQIPVNRGDHKQILYPVGAVDYLDAARFEGNVLTPFANGAYVSWKLHPRVKVSIDGRYEAAYDPSLLEEHALFYAARPGWRDFLTRYPTDALLVPRTRPIAEVLRRDAAWPLVYQDDTFEVFARPGLELPRGDRRGERLVGSFP